MRNLVEVGRVLEASAADAWSLLVDTARWPKWGPSITQVECAPRLLRADSRGRVRTRLGFWLPFEVSSFEEGRAWSWRVGGLAATSHRVEPLGPSRCRVVFGVPVLAAPYALICRRALAQIASLLDRDLHASGTHASSRRRNGSVEGAS